MKISRTMVSFVIAYGLAGLWLLLAPERASDRVTGIGPVTALGVVAAAAGAVLGWRSSPKLSRSGRALVAFWGAFSYWMLGSMVLDDLDMRLDSAPSAEIRGRVTSVYDGAFGSGTGFFVKTTAGEDLLVFEHLAPGCSEGDEITIELRPGALGQPWIEGARCFANHEPGAAQ